MGMHNFNTNLLIIQISLLLLHTCTIDVYDSNKLLNDYKSEGFLDYDHYQVVIKGTPDKKKQGILERRENALKTALKNKNKVIINSLTNFYLNHHFKEFKKKEYNDTLNHIKEKTKLKVELEKFIKYGYIAFKYYNADNSAVIAYRIFKNNLYNDIISIKINK